MGVVEDITTIKQGFRTCNKGFHIILPNGWTVSTQIGMGNYCDNYDLIFDEESRSIREKKPDMESTTAEIWAWNKSNTKDYPEQPLAYQNIKQWLKFIQKVSRFKR